MPAIEFGIRQAYGKNINRYQRLLKTRLTDVERQYIESRLSDEQAAMQAIDRLPASIDQR